MVVPKSTARMKRRVSQRIAAVYLRRVAKEGAVSKAGALPAAEAALAGCPTGAQQPLVELPRHAGIGPGELAPDIRGGNPCQDVANDVEPCLVLVVGANQDPRRIGMMRAQ